MTTSTSLAPQLRELVAARRDDYIGLLSAMVAIDSGSHNAVGVRRLADHVSAILDARGWDVTLHDLAPVDVDAVGPLLEARIAGRDPSGPTVLMMAHLDTVFDTGEAARRPFSIEGTIAHGPGVCDDKSGIAAAIIAGDALQEIGLDGIAELVLVCTPDEEIGSPSSREALAEIARSCDVALCLEAARANGDIVSARKGAADLEIAITGRAAHAGIEPERGIHAALQAAHTIVELQALNGRWDGVTVNCGVVSAGRRPNIIPDAGRVEVDLRAWTGEVFDEALAEVTRVATTAYVAGVEVVVRTISSSPPMERTPVVAALVERVVADAAAMGFEVTDAATGGAADANTTASIGVPTIDGLGPIGGDDHAPSEWLDLDSIVPRVALLASLVATIGRDGMPFP